MRKYHVLKWGTVFILTLSTLSCFLQNSIAIDDPDYTKIISPGEYAYYTWDLIRGDILRIEFDVIVGRGAAIVFFIADETTYLSWSTSGGIANLLHYHGGVDGGLATFSTPKSAKYYVVFSVDELEGSAKTVQIKFEYHRGILSLISSPIGILICISIIGLFTVLIIREVKKRRIPEPTKFCDECGSPQLDGATVCQRCGKKLD